MAACDAAEHDARDVGVAGEGEGFFERDEGEGDEVGDEVGAEDEGGEVGGEESVEEVGEGVVVVGGEGVGGCDGVEVGGVEVTDVGGGGGVEDEAVDVVLEDLETVSKCSKRRRLRRTSRMNSDRRTYFAMDQGIGRVVVTCSALL